MLKNVTIWFGMVGCVVLILGGLGFADTIQIPPDADTYIDGYSGNEDTNYGTSNPLWIREDSNGAQRALFHFPLDALSGVSSGDIQQVTLNIYLNNWGGRPSHNACRLGTAWTETGATWSNANDFQESYDSFTPAHNIWVWYSPDVTNLVKAWLDGTYENYGVGVMFAGESQYKNSQIKSREDASTDLHPYLDVTYVPEPASIGLLTLGFGLWMRRRRK